MIYEYALEPEMVAAWRDRLTQRFFIREFGLGSGRLVSCYPVEWDSMVWESFGAGSDMDKARLTELVVRLQDTMIKRKDFVWNNDDTWLKNAIVEHARYPFRAVLARENPANRPEILVEDALATRPCPSWDAPHTVTVNRSALDMASALGAMLTCCCWVKFVDPYFVRAKAGHKRSLSAFLNILKSARPVGTLAIIEIHTSGDGATTEYLKDFYEQITPVGIQLILYRWQERAGGQKLHNRYILTDLGGVIFPHGLDTGTGGETDDIALLEHDQYILRCKQYDPASSVFDQAAVPLEITGIKGG